MGFLHLLLLLLFLFSPCFVLGESLAQIEEKLALLLFEVETEKSQANSSTQKTDSEPTSTQEINAENDPFEVTAILPSSLNFDFATKGVSSEDFEHPFSVQVGSSRSRLLCYRVATMLQKLEYPAFISSIDLKSRDVWHRVYIGAFATRDSAQKIKDQLFRDNITEGFLRHFPYAVQVGSSDSQEQLEQLHLKLLENKHLPYITPIQNASSGRIEGRLLVGACYSKDDCTHLLSTLTSQGFSGVVVER